MHRFNQPMPPSPITLNMLKALAGEEFGRAYDYARRCNGRMPPPPTPHHECLSAFGRMLNWRTGNAAALAAAQRMSAQWLIERHIRADLAAKWALFYINERQRNRRNPSASGRARFLIIAVALLRNAECPRSDRERRGADEGDQLGEKPNASNCGGGMFGDQRAYSASSAAQAC